MTERERGMSSCRGPAVGTGIGFGTVLAIILSWSANKSILLAIIHGLLSWIYVIYFVLFH